MVVPETVTTISRIASAMRRKGRECLIIMTSQSFIRFSVFPMAS
jgi:hypothetical protein